MAEDSGCCAKCCSKLFSLIFSIGIILFIYWLIFRPHHLRAYVDTATLSQFNLSSSATSSSLSYKVNITISLRNPNGRVGIYYDRISAAVLYSGSQLGNTDSSFDPFYQHRKTTNVIYPFFEGRQDDVNKDVSDLFGKEKGEGAYNLEVKIDAKVRHKLGFVKLRFKPKITCLLRFPVVNGGFAAAYGSKCHVKY